MPTKIIVGTAGVPLVQSVEGDDIDNPIKGTLLSSLKSGRPISEAILRNRVTGFVHRVNQYYNYAQANFVNGVPEGTSRLAYGDDIETMSQVLTDYLGTPTQAVSVAYVLPDADFVADWYISLNPEIDDEYDNLREPEFHGTSTLKFTYTAGRFNRDANVGFDIPELNTNTQSYQVEYTVGDDDTIQYLFYNPDTGTIPQLNVTESEVHPYFPIIPLKLDGEYVNEVSEYSELYETGKASISKLGSDMDVAIDDLKGNPDDKDIDSAFMTMAIDLTRTDVTSVKYLYSYFDYYRLRSARDERDYEKFLENPDGEIPSNSIVIKDQGFNVSIKYLYIKGETIQGTLDAPYERELLAREPYKYTRSRRFKLAPEEVKQDRSFLILRQKIDDNSYNEITVCGFVSETNGIYKDRVVSKNIRNIDEEDEITEKGLFVPVDILIAKEYFKTAEREKLYENAMYMFIYAVKRVKLKWYETALFKFVIVVIALVVLVYTGQDLYGAYSTLLAQGYSTYTAIALVALETIATSVVIDFAIEQAIQIFGLEAVFAAVVISIAAAVTYGDIAAFDTVITSDQLLKMSTKAIDVSMEVINDKFSDLEAKVVDFKEELEARYDKLNSIEEMLRGESPDWLFEARGLEQYVNFSETPTEMYYRTIHETNPAVLSLQHVDLFIQNGLVLPDLTGQT